MSEEPVLLIVEDNYIVALEIKKELESRGYQTQKIVTTGDQAIENAINKSPDAIIMDILLSSEIDGIEAAKQILSEKEVPIIFLTGYDDDHIRERAQKLDPADYILKPVDIQEIDSKLQTIVG